MYQQISISSIFFGLLILSTYSEEILIQIVVKKPINIVSDRYVSFSINPDHLLELCLRPSDTENATILAQNLGSAYLKITGSSNYQFTLDDKSIPVARNQVRILPSDWQALHQWISKTNLRPVVSLPYSSKQWSPRSIISILGTSNRLGVRNCIWQLGSELNTTETIEYVDDLSAFKTIVDVFRKNGSNWGVTGADITTRSKADEVELYAELSKHISESNGWTQPMEYNSMEQDDSIFLEKDPRLRSLLKSKTPVWLNVQQSYQSPKSDLCGVECETHGLRWAKTLGVSAQTGFNVVFQNINKLEIMNPSLSYYISLLHKKIMGEKVFDTKILNGDNLSPKYFTHCTKNMSGSFSVMGVNFADYKTKISTKLPNKYTGSEVYQYILTVDHGYVLLNGIPINIHSDLKPVIKIKKQNRATIFILPPRSIGFWVFPLANLKQCSTQPDTEVVSSAKENIGDDLDMRSKTASEKLLHELISEILQIDSSRNEVKRSRRHAIVKKDSMHMKRTKRSADPGFKTRRDVTLFKKFNDESRKHASIIRPRRRVTRQINNFNQINNNRFNKLFKTFDLPHAKPFKKFWNLPPPVQSTIKQNPVAIPPVISTIHDVYRVDPQEQIFKSEENPELPTGNVKFEVGEERNMDYVEFDEKSNKAQKYRVNKTPIENPSVIENQNFLDFDVDEPGVGSVPDHMYEFYNDARRPKQPTPPMPSYSELWESDVYQKAPPPERPVQRSQFEENPNNHEQTIDLIVKELPPTFRQNKENLLKARNDLNTMYVSDMDKMSTNMNLPIRHFDMNEDNFFVSKRKRRSIDSNFNDEIENKLNHLKRTENNDNENMEEHLLMKNGIKINLLDKITKIIESLEKMDDLGKYANIEKLNADIKELENFLFRKNGKFNVFKPKNRITQKDIRKKCKILSVNLEQQCLKENDFYSNRLIKRDSKLTSDPKSKKLSTLKNVFPKENTDKLNRARRATIWESSSWEDDDRNNIIVKEMYTTNEGKYNNVVPYIKFRKPVYVKEVPIEDESILTDEITILQNLPDTPTSNNRPIIIDEKTNPSTVEIVEEISNPATVQTFPVDTNVDGKLIGRDIDENQEVKEYQTPKFMKTISKSVDNWMNIVEKHVSGWWNLLT